MRLRNFSRNTLSVQAQVTVKLKIAERSVEVDAVFYVIAVQNRLAY